MINNKVHVKIGSKYEEAFRSICDLYKRGCIDASIVESCIDDRIIETSQYVFEYTGTQTAIDTGTEVGMMPGGASWFMGFRGAESNSVMGTWHNLIETVARGYHREYSLVEYIQNSLLYDTEDPEKCKETIRNIAKVLKLPFSKIEEAAVEDSVEDIYVVSLRMELFGGAGEPRPVLCKVFFRNRSGVFFPLDTSEAKTVEKYISEVIAKKNTNGQTARQDSNSATSMVDNVLNSVSKLIGGNMQRSFTESVLITNNTDAETVSELVHLEPQDDVYLQCKKLHVLGISHIQWIDTAFSIYVGDRKAFLAKLGLNSAVNLYCCCNGSDSKLIENNVVVCTSAETGITTKVRIDPTQEDLGIDEEMIDKIRLESAFAHHYFPITCSELVRRHIECTRYRCAGNTMDFEVGGKIRHKCMDCPYPEVVYRYGDGNTAYTPVLSYDSQTMRVTESDTSTCRFCGRSYVAKEVSANNLCDFCKTSLDRYESGDVGEDEIVAYKRYASMIPFHARMSAMFKKKYCFENADRLLFVVGKNKYFFDKLNLTDSGLIVKPEKRQ